MKGHPILYTPDQLDWVRDNCTLPVGDLYQAFLAQFGRTDVSAQNLHSLRKRNGWNTGRTGQFVKGQPAHNKGKPCEPGRGGRHPNSRAHQFRKGDRTGRAARNYKPVGTERIIDGYLERKIHDGMPFKSRWRAVHLINWEAVHGPLPAGHALKCLDGNKLNCAVENWQLISRGVLARLNGGRFKRRMAFDQAPAELKPTLMAIAQVEQRAKEVMER
jgi:hypothetical protein